MQYIIKLGCWAVPLKKYQIKRKLPGSSLFYQTLFISYQTSKIPEHRKYGNITTWTQKDKK